MAHTSKVAVVGLGSMGLGAAQSLLRAEIEVVGCDVNPDSCRRFESSGGTTVASPGEAAHGAGAVVVMVVNAAQTEEILFGTDGVQSTLKRGAVIISSATMSPEPARGRRHDSRTCRRTTTSSSPAR